MTRVLCSADHHFATGPRWDQCLAVHEWMVDLVAELKPDLFVTAGDLYDRASNPTEREAVAEWLQQIALVCPIAGVKGNHDRPLDVELLNRLRSKHPIMITESAAVHTIGGVTVALMAWPEPAWLAAHTGATGEELDNQARELVRTVLRGLGADLAQWHGPRLAVGHWMVDGSVASTGQPLFGMPLNVGLADLALLGADAVVCGHIHAPQGWDIESTPVVYPGSPHACNWGEAEQKSVTLLTWDDELGAVRVERIDTPARAMQHLEAAWNGREVELDNGRGLGDYAVRGDDCRLRYACPADRREEARRSAEALRDELIEMWGAHSVKVEEIVDVETRARAPEVAQARTLPDQLQEYWQATGFEPGKRRNPLLSKLAELEVSHV